MCLHVCIPLSPPHTLEAAPPAVFEVLLLFPLEELCLLAQGSDNSLKYVLCSGVIKLYGFGTFIISDICTSLGLWQHLPLNMLALGEDLNWCTKLAQMQNIQLMPMPHLVWCLIAKSQH